MRWTHEGQLQKSWVCGASLKNSPSMADNSIRIVSQSSAALSSKQGKSKCPACVPSLPFLLELECQQVTFFRSMSISSYRAP